MSKDFDTVIGLEVHVQLSTETKIFCACSTEFNCPPNTNICPVCCGYPGVLPVLNKRALELSLRVGLALNCRINKTIYFERKNYFYPDLPKGYQISQFELPIAEQGKVDLPSGKQIGITRAHMEEDAGKLIHKEKYSLVDLNRCGIPLLEIVSEPDMQSPEEAFQYLTQLKRIVQYVGGSSCDMEKGFLRCDANISLKPKGRKEFGTKVELKNMNSFKGVKDALEYEQKRQAEVLSRGGKIYQETRLWDESAKKTKVMRSKEESHDYRYFPEPDLVNFTIAGEMVAEQEKLVGELPLTRKNRFIEQYQLSEKEAEVLISDRWLADFFESCCLALNDAKKISNLLLGPFLELVNGLEQGFAQVKISPESFAVIVSYFSQGKINNLGAKQVLTKALTTNEDIDGIIEKEGLVQVSGEEELLAFALEAIDSNPAAVTDYLSGKKGAVMFLVGCVMKKTRGKANPKIVKELLEKNINKRKG